MQTQHFKNIIVDGKRMSRNNNILHDSKWRKFRNTHANNMTTYVELQTKFRKMVTFERGRIDLRGTHKTLKIMTMFFLFLQLVGSTGRVLIVYQLCIVYMHSINVILYLLNIKLLRNKKTKRKCCVGE